MSLTESSISKKFIDWSFIDYAVNRLAIHVQNSGIEIGSIVGLPRGGLIPAVMLSHRLDIPLTYYDDFDSIGSENILIVDDICDSGDTLKPFKQYSDHCYTATIHYKLSAIVEPNFWYMLASEKEWIVYPWESKNSLTIQDYKTTNNGT